MDLPPRADQDPEGGGQGPQRLLAAAFPPGGRDGDAAHALRRDLQPGERQGRRHQDAEIQCLPHQVQRQLRQGHLRCAECPGGIGHRGPLRQDDGPLLRYRRFLFPAGDSGQPVRVFRLAAPLAAVQQGEPGDDPFYDQGEQRRRDRAGQSLPGQYPGCVRIYGGGRPCPGQGTRSVLSPPVPLLAFHQRERTSFPGFVPGLQRDLGGCGQAGPRVLHHDADQGVLPLQG